MSPHSAVFLLGLFGIPAALLYLGHHLRKRSHLRSRIFWGGVFGYLIGAVLALAAAVVPPEQWSSGNALRGFFGLWGLLAFPLIGALIGFLNARTR